MLVCIATVRAGVYTATFISLSRLEESAEATLQQQRQQQQQQQQQQNSATKANTANVQSEAVSCLILLSHTHNCHLLHP